MSTGEGRVRLELLDLYTGDDVTSLGFIVIDNVTMKRYRFTASQLSGGGGGTITDIDSGTSLPASPSVGELFILTQADGSNAAGAYICLTAGTWTRIAAASARQNVKGQYIASASIPAAIYSSLKTIPWTLQSNIPAGIRTALDIGFRYPNVPDGRLVVPKLPISDSHTGWVYEMYRTVQGGVSSMTVTAGGTGYTAPPNITSTGNGSGDAAGEAIVSGGAVTEIIVTDPGSEHTAAPTISFDTGSGAMATATVASGAVTAVSVDNVGMDYTQAPDVSFTGGGGSGATAIATIDTRGRVSEITVTDGGMNYTSAPTVTLTSTGSGAAATASINTATTTMHLSTGILPLGGGNFGHSIKEGTAGFNLTGRSDFSTGVAYIDFQTNSSYTVPTGTSYELRMYMAEN